METDFGVESERESRSVMSYFLRPHGLQPAKLLCPWNSPGQTTGVGSCSLLLGIFPTYGSDPGLPHYMRILHHLNHQGSPTLALKSVKYPGVVCVICCLSYLLIT